MLTCTNGRENLSAGWARVPAQWCIGIAPVAASGFVNSDFLSTWPFSFGYCDPRISHVCPILPELDLAPGRQRRVCIKAQEMRTVTNIIFSGRR